MRDDLARVLLTGLLAIGLQGGYVRAADATAAGSRVVAAAAQAQRLLPATLALLQTVEHTALAHGRALTPAELRIARRLGVTQPEHVRVLVTPVLPSWMAPDLLAGGKANGSSAADTNPAASAAEHAPPERRYGVAGLTAGHGILLAIRHAHNPRVLAHELAHVAQYERLGMRAFALRYLTELLSVGYYRAPLELEADAAMRRVLAIPQPSDCSENLACR